MKRLLLTASAVMLFATPLMADDLRPCKRTNFNNKFYRSCDASRVTSPSGLRSVTRTTPDTPDGPPSGPPGGGNPGAGNPGNNKSVGNAGENPNGKGGWGNGDRGKNK